MNFFKRFEIAKKRSAKALGTFSKAHAKLAKEQERLNEVIDDLEAEITHLRQLRDSVVEHYNQNDTVLTHLLKLLGIGG